MAKIRLVGKQYAQPIAEWIRPWFDPWFDIEYYDAGTNYNVHNTVYYVSSVDQFDSTAENFRAAGFRVVVDNLAEVFDQSPQGCWTMQNANWFWYYESLRHRHFNHSYTPCKTYQHRALMPMRRKRPHRDLLLKYMMPFLNDFVWSYVERGRTLPGDDTIQHNPHHQRHFDPAWYDSTCFSVVSETHEHQLLITEKTYKPIAFYHPFLIAGAPGSLAHLRQQGFVTFDNLFDESYDFEPNYRRRLRVIAENIENYQTRPYDSQTLDRLQHNADLYYNYSVVEKRLQKEIIEPLLEYAQTR